MGKKSKFQPDPKQRLISEARRNLQNPYAYLGSEGQLEAQISRKDSSVSPLTGAEGFKRFREFAASYRGSGSHEGGWSYSEAAISAIAKRLQREYWTARNYCWPSERFQDPVEFLEPKRFLRAFAYNVSEGPLGTMRTENGSFDVAGIIDNDERRVVLADTLEAPVARFTAAHELGHAVLHDQSGLHRDRPLDGGSQSGPRATHEVEADCFAVHFLMPEKLVRAEFLFRFGVPKLELTQHQLVLLDPSANTSLVLERRILARAAATKRLNSEFGMLLSLAERFGVSNEAMAIRLEELDLV